MLSSFDKDSLHYLQSSFVVYIFKYQYEAEYIGRNIQYLETGNGQHVHANIRRGVANSNTCLIQATCESSIGQHLVDNPGCAVKYTDTELTIFYRAR